MYCHERFKCKANGAQKPECTQSTTGFRAPLNEAIEARNRYIEVPLFKTSPEEYNRYRNSEKTEPYPTKGKNKKSAHSSEKREFAGRKEIRKLSVPRS